MSKSDLYGICSLFIGVEAVCIDIYAVSPESGIFHIYRFKIYVVILAVTVKLPV